MSTDPKSSFEFEEFVDKKIEPNEIVDKYFKNVYKCYLSGPKLSLNVLQEKHERLDKAINELEQKIHEKKKTELLQKEDIKILKDACASKKEYENNLRKSILTLKNEISAMETDFLAKNDQQKLKKCKKKLALYELCTGVIFDYSRKDVVKGFVQNPVTNYINAFSIEKNVDVETALWEETAKAGTISCSQHSSLSEYQEE